MAKRSAGGSCKHICCVQSITAGSVQRAPISLLSSDSDGDRDGKRHSKAYLAAEGMQEKLGKRCRYERSTHDHHFPLCHRALRAKLSVC